MLKFKNLKLQHCVLKCDRKLFFLDLSSHNIIKVFFVFVLKFFN